MLGRSALYTDGRTGRPGPKAGRWQSRLPPLYIGDTADDTLPVILPLAGRPLDPRAEPSASPLPINRAEARRGHCPENYRDWLLSCSPSPSLARGKWAARAVSCPKQQPPRPRTRALATAGQVTRPATAAWDLPGPHYQSQARQQPIPPSSLVASSGTAPGDLGQRTQLSLTFPPRETAR